jgi:protein SCO1/2
MTGGADALALAMIMAVLALLGGCGKKESGPAKGASAQEFFVRGVVREVKPDGHTAIIQHEKIPNYMEAMTMPFRAREAGELAGLQPGDAVHFRFVVAGHESWIDRVTRTGRAATNAPGTNPPPRRDFRAVRDVEPLKIGDLLPNYPLTNQLGRAFGLHEFKGRALAITFIFTRCPVPDFCPRMSNHFAAAQKQLLATPEAPVNWHFLSVSFDVDRDTPEVLKSYAERIGYDPVRWTFATGALVEVDALTEQFGLVFPRDGGVFNHNLRTVVVDAAGRVQRVFLGNEWKPAELVAEMTRAAQAK